MSVKQPSSYLNLTTEQRAFVSLYIRNGCNAENAIRSMFTGLSDEQVSRKAKRFINDQNIMTALSDKLTPIESKYLISRESMTKRLFDLIEDVSKLPDAKQKVSHLRLILDVYREVNHISGLQHVNVHSTSDSNITINVQPVDSSGNPIIDVQAEVVPPADVDPAQLPIAFPQADPVTYTLDELLNPEDHEDEFGSDDESPLPRNL